MTAPTPVQVFINNWTKNNIALFDNDLNKSSKFVDNFVNAIDDIVTLEELIKDIPSTELHKYVAELKLVSTSVTIDKSVQVVDDLLFNVLSVGIKSDCVKKINKAISYEECMLVSEMIRTSSDHYAFFISNNNSIKGKILGNVRDNKIKVDLIKRYSPKSEDADPFSLYFGQGVSKAKCVHTLSADFYAYTFEASPRQYLLLSLEEIKTQRIVVNGMFAQVSDNLKVGESFQLPANLNVIFVHNVVEEKREFTIEEIRALIGIPTFEELREMMFGRFEHPVWLEELLFAWEFSYPVDGYPLHLSIIGPPGSGKSESIINPLSIVIPDVKTKGISTFRGLIPSFGGKGIGGFNEGALLQADRVCYLDEFLTPVCSGGNNYDEISNLFGKLNSLLEWDVGSVSSGNGRNMNIVTPTMQVLACSNFQAGVPDIVKVAQRLNNATLSRMFWYVQNQENIDFTKSRIPMIMGLSDEERMPKENDNVIALYDFCKGTKVSVDFNWVIKTAKKYEKIVPSELKGMYARYNHHLGCLVDGICKLRWIVGEKDNFVADEKDYAKAEEIYSIVISSWNSTEEQLISIPKSARVKHLNSDLRKVYDRISEYGGTTLGELTAALGHCDVSLEYLTRVELVYIYEGKHYAYWHNFVRERQLEVTKNGQNYISQWETRDF